MEAKVRFLWGFSATWWKVMPMHNAWGEREDFVWQLFIDHQSPSTTDRRTPQPTVFTRCNLSQIKKAGDSRKTGIQQNWQHRRGLKKTTRNVDVLFSVRDQMRGRGEGEPKFVSEKGFNRNIWVLWSPPCFVPTLVFGGLAEMTKKLYGYVRWFSGFYFQLQTFLSSKEQS